MTFQRPDLLQLAPAVALILLIGVVARWRRGLRLIEAYGGREVAARLLHRRLERFPIGRAMALVAAAGALAVAAAGPEPERPEPPPPPAPIDLVIAVDVSLSMSGDDVEGTRIGRARQLVERIVDEGVADRIALSLFADWPYELVPLTDDGKVIDFFTPWISPGLLALRDQGTSLARLVGLARGVGEERARPNALPVVLIVSDGEVHGTGAEVLDSIRALASSGVQVWTAGAGSAGGAPLFVSGSQGAPLLDNSGQPVVAAFDPELLRTIADQGEGHYYDIGSDRGIDALVSDLRTLSGSAELEVTEEVDPGRWLLVLALLALLADALLDAGVPARGRSGAARSRGAAAGGRGVPARGRP